MNPLAELLSNRLAELDLSYRDAAARTHGMVSHSTLQQAAMGRVPRTGWNEKTITGFALSADLPASRVRAAAEEALGWKEGPEFRLPKKANSLTPRQRKIIMQMVDALLEGKGE